MPFYSVKQNNTYGTWQGPAEILIAEADNEEEARRILIDMGAYEDDGQDCPCCGSRWSLYFLNESKEPSQYNTPIAEYVAMGAFIFPKDIPAAIVRYKDKPEATYYYEKDRSF